MKGLIVDNNNPNNPRLVQSEVPTPRAGCGELLVRVEMAGLNRADLVLPKDHYAANEVGGSELAGEVVEVGADCSGFAVGDRVLALSRGSHAEFACVDHRIAVHVPDGIDWQVAAALPAWYMTAHDALITNGELNAGETVLIQGITSGVGQAAAQLARLRGARSVIGVARSGPKLNLLTNDEVDHRLLSDSDWPAAVREITDGRGVDLVIDMVGGSALGGNLDSLALRGRMVAVGRLGGATDTLDLGMLAFKRARLIGVTFRSRDIDEKVAIARAFAAGVLPHVVSGRIRPRTDRIFSLAEAGIAQNLMRRNDHFGKVLLAIR
ncbi:MULTISPECIES: zinc-binding dehydrogenase [Burkholderia cepacia complex]|uniref:zinc-binding dehydrogenase n=1 Tax=Burkholderia cepacia complex TaxID=87882 RepID=UPI000D1A0B59|nr:zinc-binding dehydrogenase [Burkholderia metallica]